MGARAIEDLDVEALRSLVREVKAELEIRQSGGDAIEHLGALFARFGLPIVEADAEGGAS